jgi:hypothetical protein
MYFPNQSRQISHRDRVVGNMGGHNIRGQRQEFTRFGLLGHFDFLPSVEI